MVAVSSWGRLGNFEYDVLALSDRHQVATQLKNSRTGIAYGMGRSYGDVCLNPGGVLWRDIQRLVIPRGWILHYANPQGLWLVAISLIYRLTQLWIKPTRRERHDTPLVFAAYDFGSSITILAMITSLAAH